VEVRKNGSIVECKARREVILSLGVFGTPKLLQISGIGPAEVLRGAGIDVVVDSSNVGTNLREHRSPMFQFRLNKDVGYNKLLKTKARQLFQGIRYFIDHRGVMSQTGFDIVAFIKTRPELERPDAQVLISPISSSFTAGGGVESEPGLQCMGIVLRPESQGTVAITSADPDADLDIRPNFFTSAYDRQVIAGVYRASRKLFEQSPIAQHIDHETRPGPTVSGNDESLAENARIGGFSNYHGSGTVAMGPSDDAAIDQHLRVRGVKGLRVVDTSALPTMVSCGTNAPAMVLGWHAGQLILSDY
jgi:choline dehydrogenase-like flavoprotein